MLNQHLSLCFALNHFSSLISVQLKQSNSYKRDDDDGGGGSTKLTGLLKIRKKTYNYVSLERITSSCYVRYQYRVILYIITVLVTILKMKVQLQ